MDKSWYLYILRCGDGTLYTGITTDVEARLEMHRSGKGAKYTRGRGPLELVYREECENHSQALKRELAVKAMSREEKQSLINK
jgi:predicted GIY-YIG superfamily endonuclease